MRHDWTTGPQPAASVDSDQFDVGIARPMPETKIFFVEWEGKTSRLHENRLAIFTCIAAVLWIFCRSGHD